MKNYVSRFNFKFFDTKRTLEELLKSSMTSRSTVTDAKFEVEKFDRSNNFSMWQFEVIDVLFQ